MKLVYTFLIRRAINDIEGQFAFREMKSLLLVAIALGVNLFEVSKGDNGHHHKRSNVGKASKNKVKQRHPGVKRGTISSSLRPFGHSHEEAFNYVIETIGRHHNDGRKRRDKILQPPKEWDYQNEWANECSLKSGGKKKQLDIPGCGGWVKLDCPGGCLAIDKV